MDEQLFEDYLNNLFPDITIKNYGPALTKKLWMIDISYGIQHFNVEYRISPRFEIGLSSINYGGAPGEGMFEPPDEYYYDIGSFLFRLKELISTGERTHKNLARCICGGK